MKTKTKKTKPTIGRPRLDREPLVRLDIRIPAPLRAELEAEAADDLRDLSAYVRLVLQTGRRIPVRK